MISHKDIRHLESQIVVTPLSLKSSRSVRVKAV